MSVEESIEIPDANGARKSKLVSSGETIRFQYEDVTTLWELMQRGCRVSDNGRCLGWRSSKFCYSWANYRDVLDRAEHFGSGLIDLGMIPGQLTKIGIYAQNSVEWLVVAYGCYSQSLVVVPLYDVLGPNACTYTINHAETQVVICDTEHKVRNLLNRKDETPILKHIIVINNVGIEVKQLAKEKHVCLHFFQEIEELGEKNPAENLLPRSYDVSLICYTSGTTGDSKGVVLTHGNFISAANGICLQMGDICFNKKDTMISYLPLAHIMEQIAETCIFLNGGCVGFFSGDVNLLLDDIKVLQPTYFPAVPKILNKIYEKAQDMFKRISKLSVDPRLEGVGIEKESEAASFIKKAILDSLGGKLRLILSGGAPISVSILNFYRTKLGLEVLEVYGQTECTGPCCLNSVADNTIGTVGPPLPCCLVKLVDVPEMGYLSENKQGEICMKGHNVFRGYYKDSQRTLEILDRDGWLHTGDIGMWMPNGTMKIVDRKKNIFKLSQGEYISPEKIENVYLRSPYVFQIMVHGDSLKDYLVAIVIPEKEVLLSWCKDKFKDGTWNETCKNREVKQLILEDINRLGKSAGFQVFEQVRKIHLHPEVLTLEDGFLTPTLKTKRAVLKKFFAKEIEAMYDCQN